MSYKLPTYLRTYRRRSGLTQAELAFLLGCDSGTVVCRLERRVRRPNLNTALGCQVIFDCPAEELFPGLYAEVEKTITHRAHLLAQRLRARDPRAVGDHKLKVLAAITSRQGGASGHRV